MRTYAFLSSILPYSNEDWEKRSMFLNFLIPKLPAPEEEDLSKGVLEAIDIDSYRVEKQAMQKIVLADEDAEIGPVPTQDAGGRREPQNSIGCRTSSPPSTTCSETSRGRTTTA